jgi:predicted nucleic acid-binding protein
MSSILKPNYKVQAHVVDIRSDNPKQNDLFLVDSNVWYWYSYTSAILSSNEYQITYYPSYLTKANSAKSLLLYCGLSLAELAHRIEKEEKQNSYPTLDPKIYRRYPKQRNKVVAEVQTAWGVVTSIAACTEIMVDETTTNTSLLRFQTQLLDGYDLFILEAMNKAGVTQIITDDKDFLTVPGIQVFTANIKAIEAAKKDGKFLSRK